MPRAGIAWLWVPELRLSANVGRFFRVPSIDELYHQSAAVSGNRELRPEEGHSMDAQLELRPTLRSIDHVSIGLFRTHFDSLIFFAPIDAFRFQSQNHPGGQVRGVELSSRIETQNIAWTPITDCKIAKVVPTKRCCHFDQPITSQAVSPLDMLSGQQDLTGDRCQIGR